MIINALTFFIRFFLYFCNNILKLSLILLCRVLQLNAN